MERIGTTFAAGCAEMGDKTRWAASLWLLKLVRRSVFLGAALRSALVRSGLALSRSWPIPADGAFTKAAALAFSLSRAYALGKIKNGEVKGKVRHKSDFKSDAVGPRFCSLLFTSELIMYPFRNILFPTDFTLHARAALKYAAAFAREGGGRIVLFSVQSGTVPANLLTLPERVFEDTDKRWLQQLRTDVRSC